MNLTIADLHKLYASGEAIRAMSCRDALIESKGTTQA